MKMQCCVRINSQPLCGKGRYYFVKDGLGGISVLKDGERIGYADGTAAGCSSVEVVSGRFAAACRVRPVIRLGNYAIFKITGIRERFSAAFLSVFKKDAPAPPQSSFAYPHTISCRIYPSKIFAECTEQHDSFMQYD